MKYCGGRYAARESKPIGLLRMMSTRCMYVCAWREVPSLGCHNDFNAVSPVGRGEVSLQSTRVAHTSVRVIHKTDEGRAIGPRGIAGGIRRNLFGEVSGRQAGARLFDDHHRFLPVEQVAGSGCAVRIGRSPLFRADLIELQSEERIEEILQVILVVDLKRRTVFLPKPQLARHEVKPGADSSQYVQRAMLGGGLRFWQLVWDGDMGGHEG